jgi:hypothetical protein
MTKRWWKTGWFALGLLIMGGMSIARGELATYSIGSVTNNGGLDAVDGQYLVVGCGQWVEVKFPTALPAVSYTSPIIRVHMVGNPTESNKDAWIALTSDTQLSWWGPLGTANYDRAESANLFPNWGWGLYDDHLDIGMNVPVLANVTYLSIYNPTSGTELKIDAVESGPPFSEPVNNHAPVAGDIAVNTDVGAPINIDILASAYDPDGDPLTLTVGSATHGDVTLNSDGTVKYTPNSGFSGVDTFIYTVSDDKDATAIGNVTVTVNGMWVTIDIKPGSYPNAINLGSNGVVPVAILSAAGFDAPAEVDLATVKLAGAGVAVRGKANRLMASSEDVNGDGLADLVLQVETENLNPDSLQDGVGTIVGATIAGVPIIGTDEITLVPPK